MKKILLDNTKKFYKGNLHCHSTQSDGKKTPEELKEMYKKAGYSVLAITDHEILRDNSYLDDEEFITITSTEYAIKQFSEQSTLKNFDMKVCHLNLYARNQHNTNCICYNSVLDHYSDEKKHAEMKAKYSDYERIYSTEGINEIIKTANENGFFVSYNHPRWSLENYGDYCGYEGIWAVEIFNTSCNFSGIYEYDINVLDDFLRDGKRIFATCGDDNHNSEKKNDSFGCCVMINADELKYDKIIDALTSGNFYTTTGPEISELWTRDGKVFIKCSNAKRITYSTHGRRARSVVADEESWICEAEFEIKEADKYFRIDVIDEFGKRANTQAYFLDEL